MPPNDRQRRPFIVGPSRKGEGRSLTGPYLWDFAPSPTRRGFEGGQRGVTFKSWRGRGGEGSTRREPFPVRRNSFSARDWSESRSSPWLFFFFSCIPHRVTASRKIKACVAPLLRRQMPFILRATAGNAVRCLYCVGSWFRKHIFCSTGLHNRAIFFYSRPELLSPTKRYASTYAKRPLVLPFAGYA